MAQPPTPPTEGRPADPPSTPTPTEPFAGDWLNLSAAAPPPTTPRPAAPAPSAPPPERVAHYRLLRLLGEGGMGRVYLALDEHLQRRVALKVAHAHLLGDPTARGRFLREARMMARLRHENVALVFEAGEAEGVPYLAMELLQGRSLDDHLRQGLPLNLAQILRIGRETALGLAAAHAQGLVHRDVKPANLWLEAPKGRVKILDFGLARTAKDDGQLTKSGYILGTPAYMAPEQAKGQPVGPACDLFSLGAVLYRLCCGRLPFPGGDTLAILTALATVTPDPPAQLNPAVPPALDALIRQLLCKDPAGRPASARAVADALRKVDASPQVLTQTLPRPGTPPSATLTAVPPPAPPLRGRVRRWLILGSAAALLIAVTAGLTAWSFWDAPTPGSGAGSAAAEEPAPPPLPPRADRPREPGLAQQWDLHTAEYLWACFLPVAKKGYRVVTLNERAVGFLRVYDLTGKEHTQLTGGGQIHRRLAVSADGRFVAAAFPDVALWRADHKGEPPQQLPLALAVHSVALSPDGRYLAAGTSAGQLRVWDTGRLPEPVADVANAQANWVDALAFAPDGRTLYSAGHKDRRVRAWDPATGQLKAEWDVFPEETAGAAEGCWALAVAPDGKHLAASGHGGQVFLVDTATGAVVRRLLGGAGSVAFSPDGKWLALGQVAGGWVALWEAATAKSGPAFKAHFPAGVRGVMFSPDSKYLLTSGTDGKVKLWTVADLVAGGGP